MRFRDSVWWITALKTSLIRWRAGVMWKLFNGQFTTPLHRGTAPHRLGKAGGICFNNRKCLDTKPLFIWCSTAVREKQTLISAEGVSCCVCTDCLLSGTEQECNPISTQETAHTILCSLSLVFSITESMDFSQNTTKMCEISPKNKHLQPYLLQCKEAVPRLHLGPYLFLHVPNTQTHPQSNCPSL